jgi:PadR family transcriptional regulator, regulatory protein PadR
MAKAELLPGTLDMLVLKTVSRGSMHGYGIAQHIRQISDDVLQVEEGSLYPALQRLLTQRFLTSEWRTSDTNRRARFYSLTALGRKQLRIEASQFDHLVAAIARVMQTA